MLKTLDNYIDGVPEGVSPLASLWSRKGRDRRFTRLFATSVALHLIFYVALILLDSWAMRQAIANNRQQGSLVKLIELASPPDKTTLRAAPEPLERADVSRLQYDPATADDVHLVQRSPKPTERRGNASQLPSADAIERQLRAAKGSGKQNNRGKTSEASPPNTSSVLANRVPQFDEALKAQMPPTQAAAAPPPPSPKPDPAATSPASTESSAAGTRHGSSSDSSALGLENAQGQYMAYVRAKIRKTNERSMPREWIRDVLHDKVSADFSLEIKRDGQIMSTRLIRSSGYSVLDAQARQAIFTASPFEGFPPNAGNTIIFTVTVFFYTL